MSLIKHGLNQLLPHQIDVLQECLKKQSAGLALVMGYGKSFISIVLGLMQRNKCKITIPLPAELINIVDSFCLKKVLKLRPILVIVTKTLILSWSAEIKKFFGSLIKYQIYYEDPDNFVLKDDTVLVLTTPQILIKYYKEHGIAQKIANNNKTSISGPILSEGHILYSITWSCLIIDEIQKLTNIGTKGCQSIIAIAAYYKYGLSGTMFDEPKAERILGYYRMLSLPFEPTTIPSTKKYMKKGFTGLQDTMIIRTKNEAFVEPIINKKIVEHSLSEMEQYIYTSLLYTLNTLIKIQKALADNNNANDIQIDLNDENMLKGAILIVLQYLRQCLISPYNVATKIMEKSEIVSETFSTVLKKLNNEIGLQFNSYILDKNNEKSRRISKVLEILDKHKDERVLVFSCFRVSQELLIKYSNRQILSLESQMTIEQRFQVIENFKRNNNSVLFLTYSIGAEGLNLQCSHTILLIDFWWSCGRSNQAIARILRYGQLSSFVNIYFFTANTGLERGLFFKHEDKLTVLDELLIGPKISNIRSLKTAEIIKILINSDENKQLLKKINKI